MSNLNIHFCGPESAFSTYPRVEPEEILEYCKDLESLEIDTETDDFDPHKANLITLQIGNQVRQFVIDVRYVNVLLFKELIENKLCLLHNAKFDYKILYKNGILLDKIYDTFLAEGVIFNGLQRGLGLRHLTNNYLGIVLEKETRNTFSSLGSSPLSDRQIKYAGGDVAYLHRIRRVQLSYIEKYDLQCAVDIENQVLKAFADIELNGMYLDRKEWTELALSKKKERAKVEIELDDLLIDKGVPPVTSSTDLFGKSTRSLTINYNSSQQVKDIANNIYILGLKDTSARTLSKHKDNEFISKILDHRGLTKKVSTYGDEFLNYINPITGRVHTDFWQIKNTFRVGSGNKKANAPNVQNIPSGNEYRNCFKPREGFKWVSIDYSSQELRLMADFSGEDKFIEALNEGIDLHCFAYNTMTGENITKKDKDKRTKAKVINFGKPYGMSPHKLADTLDISVEEAEELFDLYARAFPKLNRWLDDQWRFGNKYGYIVLNDIHKGRRWFPEFKELQNGTHSWKEKNRLKGIIGRASMNTPIQGEYHCPV